MLVFLSGEREIHDTADALRRIERPGTEVLPLYARLSSVEQHRIFQPHTGRRVVLSTNVAETSLTVPGVRFVVDAGTARISRYSRRLKVQRLPIEPVSQASADQRAGRCGRVAPGTCIRLYSEEDLASRSEFTEPEILRTNLASVILQMTAIGLGDVAAFPFVEPPDAAAVRDGYQLLEELAAIGAPDAAGVRPLTPIGKRLARLPIDPRLGRMVLEADRHGCVREVLVIAAALSIQDPRERPLDERADADAAHRRFDIAGPTCSRSSPCGITCAPSSGPARRTSFASCVALSTSTTCVFGSGRTSTASCAASPATSEFAPVRRVVLTTCPAIPTMSTRRCSPACCRSSGSATAILVSSAAGAARPSSSLPARCWPRSRRAG